MFKFIGALVVYGFAAFGVACYLKERSEDDGALSFDKASSRLKTFEVVK